MRIPALATRPFCPGGRSAVRRLILCSVLALGLVPAGRAGLAAYPQTSTPQADPFYLKLLDAGERSLKAGAFTAASRDLEIAVFGLARDPRLAGKAYLLLAVCRDALLDKDKSRANLTTAAGLLGPEGARGLDLDERTLAVVRDLVEAYKIPLTLPAAPMAKVEAKAAPPAAKPTPELKSDVPAAAPAKTAVPPPAPKIEKAAPETKKPAQGKKEEETSKAKTKETTPAAKKPAADRTQGPAKIPGKVEAPPPDKVPVKAETTAPKKERPTPAKGTAAIEGPKPVFRPPESLPDVRELEKKLAADPSNAGLVYEIVPRYFERKDFKGARRALEGLRAKRPLELRARLLLAKTDFFLKDYAASLEELRAISAPSSKARPGPEESRTIALFTAFSLAFLDQFKSAISILDPLRSGLTPEEFAALIETEGLGAQWAALRPRFGK